MEMQINIDAKFDRVHILGRPSYHQPYPRTIIAWFESFEDREHVRAAASKSLVDKRYGVREQFPPEIEQKRKLLYPIAERACLSRMNTVRLVRDKLYVNAITLKMSQKATVDTDKNQTINPDHVTMQKQHAKYRHLSKMMTSRNLVIEQPGCSV